MHNEMNRSTVIRSVLFHGICIPLTTIVCMHLFGEEFSIGYVVLMLFMGALSFPCTCIFFNRIDDWTSYRQWTLKHRQFGYPAVNSSERLMQFALLMSGFIAWLTIPIGYLLPVLIFSIEHPVLDAGTVLTGISGIMMAGIALAVIMLIMIFATELKGEWE